MTTPQPPYGIIKSRLGSGRVVPFLGAGASLGAKPKADPGAAGPPVQYLPSGADLARALAVEAAFPSDDPFDRDDLAKVAAWYAEMEGRTGLRERLRRQLLAEYEPTPLHCLLASVEAPLVIFTTNYDTLLERAFRDAGRPYDLVIYPTDKEEIANAVLWWPDRADEPTIESAAELDLDLKERTVIYKMHGTVVTEPDGWDSFVITEDDYIDFLFRMTSNSAVPAIFYQYFRSRSFLFLGYGLRDWNLRVVLRSLKAVRAASDGGSDVPDWAIQKQPSAVEEWLWRSRGVLIFDVPLDDFVERLQAA